MTSAYGNGSRCLCIESIDRLPGEAALVLHGVTDVNSSPLHNAFILLTIADPPAAWAK